MERNSYRCNARFSSTFLFINSREIPQRKKQLSNRSLEISGLVYYYFERNACNIAIVISDRCDLRCILTLYVLS
jgi:hypothetical protein